MPTRDILKFRQATWDPPLAGPQGTVARLIIRLCINTAKQTSHPSSRVIHNVIVYNETPEAV